MRELRLALVLAVLIDATAASKTFAAPDVHQFLIGCWERQPSPELKRQLERVPGALSISTLCFRRNGETTTESFVGGGQIDGTQLEMEGMGGTGRYYISGDRLMLHGIFDFDTYGPFSCHLSQTSADRFELTACIEGFSDVLNPADSLSYVRSEHK